MLDRCWQIAFLYHKKIYVSFHLRIDQIYILIFRYNFQVSLTESEVNTNKDYFPLPYDYEIKQHRPLKMKKKFYEFYTAPITKFWADSVNIFFHPLILIHLKPLIYFRWHMCSF